MKKHIIVALIAATALVPVAASARDRNQREGGSPRADRVMNVGQDRPNRPVFSNRAPAGVDNRARRQRTEPQNNQGWQQRGSIGDFNQNRPRIDEQQRPDLPTPGQWRQTQRPDQSPRADWRSNGSPDRRQWDNQRGEQWRNQQNDRGENWQNRRDDWQRDRDERRNDWQRNRDERRDDWRQDRDDRRDGWRGNRAGSWQGSWQARRGDDRGRYDRWRDGQRWDNRWRSNNRYDWRAYRTRNRYAYHLPRYYAPRGWGYGYRRFSIGVTLGSVLYSDNYWISDPYSYRLPPAYGPYRWVRYYNDALLVDIRSGYVVDVVHDMFW